MTSKLLIQDAIIIDGTGGARVKGSVLVENDRVRSVDPNLEAEAGTNIINADGMVLAPGFIDVHTHDDAYALLDRAMPAKASQGVTSVVIGNCGYSLAPFTRSSPPQRDAQLISMTEETTFASFGDYLARLEKQAPALNIVGLVGHTTLRSNAMEDLSQPADDKQIDRMKGELKDALEAGAVGLSSGLYYPPANSAPTSEVAALAEVLAPYDGIYTAHIRDEAEHVIDAIEEAAEIAGGADVQLILSHHKTNGSENFGRTKQTLPLIEKLRKKQRIGMDVYPYTASSTMLMKHAVDRASKVLVTWCTAKPEYAGRDLDEIADEMAIDRLDVVDALSPAGAIYFSMDEEDVRRVIKDPHAMIGSDGLPWDRHPHPRLWGTFARVLGHYARDVGLLPLEEAVHRMTGLPAKQFGLKDRGMIKEGFFADLVLFDPDTILDEATFDEPEKPAAGISFVMVNGGMVWQDGAATGHTPGRPLRLKDTLRGT